MVAIIKQNAAGEITGWMVAVDMPSLRRRAQQTFDHEIAELAYRHEFLPKPGKYSIAPGITMLVD